MIETTWDVEIRIQHLIIDRINDCVQEILEDVTLKDLVDAYEGYQDSVEGMYYI